MKKISVALLIVVICFISWGQAFAAEPCTLTVQLEQNGIAKTETLSGLTGDIPFLLLRDFSSLTGVYIHWFPDSGAIGWTNGNQAVFTHPRGSYIYVVTCAPIYEELPPTPEIKAFVPDDVVALPTPADPAAYGETEQETMTDMAGVEMDGQEPSIPMEEEAPTGESMIGGDLPIEPEQGAQPVPEPEVVSPAIIGWEYEVKKEKLPTPLLVEKDKTYIHSSLFAYLGYSGVWSEPNMQYTIVKTTEENSMVNPPLEGAYGEIKQVLVKDLPAEKQVYGRYKTSFNPGEKNRTINLKLAAAAINGQIIQPGKTFSFNKTVGPRTRERGYLEATIFVGGKKEQGLGGGICQVSSTLYNAVLNSKLKVVERHTHSLPVTYVPTGKDATVSYGYLDFRFQNNRNYPVKIQAVVNKNTLDIAFVSVDK